MDKFKNISVYKKVTSFIVDILKRHRDSGCRDTWLSLFNGDILSYNAYTGKTYDWLNQVLLSYYCQQKGYGINRWLTCNQAKQLGARLLSKKENPSHVTYFNYRHYDRKSKHDITAVVKAALRNGIGKESLDYTTVPNFRFLEVFNVSQFEGLPDEYYKPGIIMEQGPEVMDIYSAAFLETCGAIVEYKDIDAFQVGTGFINVPLNAMDFGRGTFCKTTYNSVCQWAILQELCSTSIFSSLVCELFGAYLAAKQGFCMPISSDPRLVGSWIRALRDDYTFFTKSSAYARKCLAFVSKANSLFVKSRQLDNQLN